MNNIVLTTIVALLCTSMLVRVLPVFFDFQFGERSKIFFEQVLPSAVFINFVVYIVFQEVKVALFPAVISLTLVSISAFYRITGLIQTALIGSILYYLVVRFFYS